jgi:2-oxoglutarate dehydrogenase E1 component
MAKVESLPNILSLTFVEGLYAEYLRDPLSIPPDWRRYFDQISRGDASIGRTQLGPSFRAAVAFTPEPGPDRRVTSTVVGSLRIRPTRVS